MLTACWPQQRSCHLAHIQPPSLRDLYQGASQGRPIGEQSQVHRREHLNAQNHRDLGPWRVAIPGEVMISDSKDRVSREALLRSEPVPVPWAATFAWSRDWWWNQENGNIAGPHWRPSRDDVERMLGDVQGL